MLLKVKVSSKFAEYTDYEHAPNFSVTYGDNTTDNTAHIMGQHTVHAKNTCKVITMKLALAGKMVI